MIDPLTTAERMFIEHWARRKWQALRSWLLLGTIVWGGLMSYLMVYEKYSVGELSSHIAIIMTMLCFLGGAVFGFAMWGITEFRFRRMVAKDRKNGT